MVKNQIRKNKKVSVEITLFENNKNRKKQHKNNFFSVNNHSVDSSAPEIHKTLLHLKTNFKTKVYSLKLPD